MPRTPLAERRVAPALMACLDRANPRVRTVVEISAPDVGRVLRRAGDQFFTSPDPLVSLTPAASIVGSAGGAIQLTGTATAIGSTTAVGGSYALNPESTSRRVKGLRWVPAPTFGRSVLRSFTATVGRAAIIGSLYASSGFELQIYRATAVPGRMLGPIGPNGQPTSTAPWVEWTHTPLLNPAPIVPASAVAWSGAQRADVTWDLSNYGLPVDNVPTVNPALGQAGEVNAYYFVVRAVDATNGDLFFWMLDTGGPITSAGVGTFQRAWWTRESDTEQWVQTAYADCPDFTLRVDSYAPTAQAVYKIDLGAVPGAASSGRINFGRSVPTGGSATLELSTAGTGGPWVPVVHGSAVATKQQTYHLRLTLTPSADLRATPYVESLGVEFRTPYDVTDQTVGDPLGQDVAAPWMRSTIADGKLRVLRIGRPDFDDTATILGSTAAPATLEVDFFLASDHPGVTRADWLHLARAGVSNRVPTATAEEFTLLSYLSRLARKLPRKTESINTVHTVGAGSTETAVVLDAATPLLGATVSGNEYDGKGYYLRVRRSSVPGVLPGTTAVIAGNTSTLQLDVSAAAPLAGRLVAGDQVEVHSGVFATVPITFTDADLSDVWWQLLTTCGGIPAERIGRAGLGLRGGLPPTDAQIAPGDAPTQAKLKVTVHVAEEATLGDLIDQVSFARGGATVEIAGQVCFVQVYPLRDGAGNVSVTPAPTAAYFDPRDYLDLQTPPGLEQRACVVDATYGVNPVAVDGSAYPASTTTWVDGDALAWHTQQDLDVLGMASVPKEVCRFFFNSTDAGLYQASEGARRICTTASTGLRVWSFGTVDPYPELRPGDTVVLATSQATDYDPALAQALSGWRAWRAVILGVAPNRRRFTVLVLGLSGNNAAVQGGAAGALAGTATAPVPVPSVALSATRTGDARGWAAYVTASFTRPATPFFERMFYSVRYRKEGTATWSSAVRVEGSLNGPDYLPAVFGTEVEVTPGTRSTAATETLGAALPLVTIGDNPASEVTVTHVRSATYVDFVFACDSDFARGEVWGADVAANPGAALDISSPTVAPAARFDRSHLDSLGRFTYRQAIAGAARYAQATCRHFDALSRPGAPASDYAQGDASALAPTAPAGATSPAQTATTITVRTTMAGALGSPAPDHLRFYVNGSQRGGDVVLTAGAGGTQDVVLTGFSPATAYGPIAVATVAAGVESAARATVATNPTTPAATLAAPVLSGSRSGVVVSLSWTAPSNDPGNGATTYVLESNAGSGWATIDAARTNDTYSDLATAGTQFRVSANNTTWTQSVPSNVLTP